MSQSRACPQCHREISAEVCPYCLLQLALESETEVIQPDPAPGERFGPYRTLRVIGEGGMGVVYLAEQREPIQRRVALKVIKLGMDSKSVIARFESERQALALMDHPNIARVLDAGTSQSGRPYFVMEYVPGAPITEYCDRHRLSSRERLLLFQQVCQAIQHAHQKGVIHRDIKPSNILVEVVDGKALPKVIDFGVAKAVSQRLTEKTLFTDMGVLIGTPAYMSPEQAGATEIEVDTTTDIYSLGVVLYELLVGSLPFDPAELRRAGYAEICRVIREDEPPKPTTKLESLGATGAEVAGRRQTDIRTLVRQVRGDLEWITMKALEKERTRRYASASELAADIGRHLDDEPVMASPPSAAYRLRKLVRRHKAKVTAAAVVVVALAVGLAVSSVLYLQAKHDRAKALWQSYVANIHAAELHLKAIEVDAARRQLLLCDPSLRGWEWRHLWQQTDSSVETLHAPTRFTHFPFWESSFAFSADGSRIYWNAQHTLPVWDTSNYKLVAHYGGFGEILGVSRNVSRILARKSHALRLMVPQTGAVLMKLDVEADDIQSAALSPDAHYAATVLKARKGLRVWDLTSGMAVADIKAEGWRAAFSPDGTRIACSARENAIGVWEARSGKLLVTLEETSGMASPPVFSPDGEYLAAGTGDGAVRVWELKSGRLKFLGSGERGRIYALAFSPDGKRLASTSSDRGVRVWDTASPGAPATTLTGLFPSHLVSVVMTRLSGFSDPNVCAIAFSPDGRRLFVGAQFGEVRVWDATTLGGAILEKTASPIAAVAASRGASRLAVALGDGDLRVLEGLSGNTLLKLNASGTSAVALSSDGERIAAGDAGGTVRLYNARSGDEIATFHGHTAKVASVSFDPDGRYIATGSEDQTVKVWSTSSGKMEATLGLHDTVNSVVFDARGERVLIASGDRHTSPANDTTVQLWDWKKSATARPLLGGEYAKYPAMAAVFSPDGRKIAAVRSAYAEISMWDTSTWKWTGILSESDLGLWSIAFSPDGLRFVTAAYETSRLWDAARYEPLLALDTGWNPARFAAFSPDGSRVWTGAARSLRVWSAQSAYAPGAKAITEAENPSGLNETAWDAVKTPNGKAENYRLALRSAEGAVKLAPWDPNYLNTMGVAQFRNRQYREALDSLRRSDEEFGHSDTGNLIFSAMAHFQLGETGKARAELQEARNRKIQGKISDAELLGFLREAEALISTSPKVLPK